jgi:ABC-2 type transport system permease protein
MSVIQTVVAREYLTRVRTRTFLISTLAAPLIFLGFLLVPILMNGGSDSERRLALVDATGVMAPLVTPGLEAAGFQVELVAPGSSEALQLEAQLESEALGVALFLDEETLARGEATLRAKKAPSSLRRLGIQQSVTQGALALRLSQSAEGAELARLLQGGGLRLELLEGESASEGERGLAMATGFLGAFILYMVLIIYGSMVLRAVLEEKTGRIVEVILSSMRPWELLLGKIVGVGAVGLTQLAIYAAFVLLLSLVGVPGGLPFLPEGGLPFDLASVLPSGGVLAFFLLCFLGGYFLFASLFAAVGAMCSTEEEAQQLQFPIIMLVVVPIAFMMPVLENPNATSSVALSLFPFFTPILMFARVAASDVPLWQTGLSVILMVATLGLTARVAGRIYRTGILMQGKRPTLPELWRWVRTG